MKQVFWVHSMGRNSGFRWATDHKNRNLCEANRNPSKSGTNSAKRWWSVFQPIRRIKL